MPGRDAVVAAAVLMLGAVAAWRSALLPSGGGRAPGPGFLPWWVSLLIVGLGLVLLAGALVARAARGAERPPPSRGGGARRGLVKVALLVVGLALYVAGLEPLGYPLCTFLLVLFMLRALEPQRWAVALGMAIFTALASYTVFAVWLKVPLPPGPLVF